MPQSFIYVRPLPHNFLVVVVRASLTFFLVPSDDRLAGPVTSKVTNASLNFTCGFRQAP